MAQVQLRLGEILVREGLISEVQLEQALAAQRKEALKRPLGEILVSLGFISDENLALALSKKLNLPYLSERNNTLKIEKNVGLQQMIPEALARESTLLPYAKTSTVIHVAFSDPLNIVVIDNIRMMTRLDVAAALAPLGDIKKGIDELYGKGSAVKSAMEGVSGGGSESAGNGSADAGAMEDLDPNTLRKTAEEAPLVKLVDLIIMEAINNKASDIHIEIFEKKVCIRYRIDGVLYEIPPPAKQFYLALVSRIKILANLDIAEKRLPQDGAIVIRTKDKNVDLRISTMPTIYGEKVVIRVLDTSQMSVGLDKLGFEAAALEKVRRAIKKPYGMILITGPTGSGKSTTLYGVLNELRTPQKNIVTIEDPVEYKLEGVNQVQVKSQIGLTFASGLRTFLRQDPDIIMVGEVRDLETAEMCVRAALVGRLVLSTLHTNSAAIAPTRLIEFGIEPFLITSSLLMVEAQRLVRKLCPACKVPYQPEGDIAKKYGLSGVTLYKAVGCDKCRNIGYAGRAGIYEVLIVTEEIRELILKRGSADEIKNAAVRQGMQTLLESGLEKVRLGLTSLEEVLSIVFSD
ncbi:MAG: ATPase, T2SS/T4P/T4SS family [Candidatus Omnitrophota bacterium]